MNITYSVCKRIIERGNCPENMNVRIEAFYKAGLLSEEEYKVLQEMIIK